MTEFQQATLLVGWVQAGVALFVGMVQSALFFYGIKRMSDASERRALQTDRQIDAMMKQIEVMSDSMANQHEESMRRTDALIKLQEESSKRTDIIADSMSKQHEESMKADGAHGGRLRQTARGVHEADGRAAQAKRTDDEAK